MNELLDSLRADGENDADLVSFSQQYGSSSLQTTEGRCRQRPALRLNIRAVDVVFCILYDVL